MSCLPWAGLAVLLVGCASSHPADSAAATSPNPTVATVKRQDLTGYRFSDGKLVIPSSAQATAYSPYDTPVASVMTSTGKHVERGEPIVKLTIPGADQAASQAKADATVAAAALSNQKSLASGPVQAAQQALKDARAAEKAAQDTVAGGGTADVAEATQTRIDAESALRTAQEQLQQSVEPASQAATATVAQLQAVKADAAQGMVRAPISGTVVTLTAQPGIDAKSNQALATVIDFAAVRVQATVPPDLRDVVVRGSRVIVAMSGPSLEPMDGRVLSVKVSPPASGEQSSGYLANIEFTKPRSMPPGSVDVRRVGFKTGHVNKVLVVPVGAVVSQDGQPLVKVKKGSDWVSEKVVTGLSDGNLIEIKSGLTEGDVVQVPASP